MPSVHLEGVLGGPLGFCKDLGEVLLDHARSRRPQALTKQHQAAQHLRPTPCAHRIADLLMQSPELLAMVREAECTQAQRDTNVVQRVSVIATPTSLLGLRHAEGDRVLF